MEKLLFIVNPTAGAGKAKKSVKLIEERMKREDIEYKIIFTNAPKEATTIAQNSIDEYRIIVAVGGDGTVNEVAKGIINKGRGVLGVLPCGTGNDYSKALGIPQKVEEALDVILMGNTKVVDVGKINGYNIFNIASVGFDTEVAMRTNRIKKTIKNKFSYLFGTLVTLFSYKKRKFDIVIDDVRYTRNLVLLAMGKGKCYGGGLQILPMAELTDGQLHVCLVRNISNLGILFLFPSIFKGKHIRFKKYVEIFSAKKIVVENSEEINLNIDGEIFQTKENITIEIEKAILEVISNPT
ncbi:MAG: diacylglycerol kinase family lipid kinase [Clostridiales bacterium]|nr:diacylglycerol kinase family lipid kinase [Clostridiales bacterium]